MMSLMKARSWLTGWPEYRLKFANRQVPGVLLGGMDTARAISAESVDEDQFIRRFEAEYRSILDALLRAGMPFRILNLSTATSALSDQLRADGYPEFRINAPEQGSTFLYPRDLMVYLTDHDIALTSPSWLKPGVGNRAGVSCWATDWSEGGRVLFSGDTIVVFRHPEKPNAPEQEILNQLRDLGLRVVEIPAGIFCSMDQEGHLSGLFHDHHIDRAAGLVRAPDGTNHLLLGPGYRTGPLNAPLDAATSIAVVREICDTAGIVVHAIPDTALPYATSLVQSPEGTVVISGGNESLAELLETIVGVDAVVTTSLPITHFPVFASAGIHCLVTESPDFLLAPRRAIQL